MLFLNMISLASIDRYSIALMLKIKNILILSIVKAAVTNSNAFEKFTEGIC